jgi:hypothetical protein
LSNCAPARVAKTKYFKTGWRSLTKGC